MPGILPMKVIKVGNSAQSRIAQACDRCRSKKVRCDGVRPTCSQCANVGFECRTSDKLSRRAFPRGYTESLEERVRQLETEVRELKDLLDEKDEKLDILSTMQGNYCQRPSIPSSTSHTLPSPGTSSKASPASPSKEDSFRVESSPLLFSVENSDSYFMGPSSGRSFIVSFKRRLQELGKPCADFNPDAFLHVQGCAPLTSGGPVSASRPPPRIFSDRCVNVYFQELASLFPVLHKPSFLRIYEEFVSDPEKIKCHHQIAQLYLIFSIAGVSSENPDIQQIAVCERKWSQAIQSLVLENTLSTLQCLILALLYCMLRADNKRVQHFKGLAVGLSHRLGLHQSQKRFSFGVLTLETRKRVFWTLYTLDCFSSATLGLPKLLKEEDVQTEYPSDSDDEYVTENGFQPTLPGEYTRLSSALALFRMSRILARILERNYPSAVNYELSLQQLAGFEAELDAWYEELPMHLRLTFSQDKPSTDMTGSRSPLLALAFHHVRSLIYRPAVGSSLGDKAAPALLSIADSSKRIIQIVQLLEERNMSFSFCLNKYDLLSLCTLTLLYQVVELKQDSKLTRDIERLVNVAIKTLNKAKASGCVDLARIAGKLIVVEEGQCRRPSASKDAGKKTATCRQQQDRVRRMTVSDAGAGAELNALLRQPFGGVETAPLDTRRQGDEISAARADKGPCGAVSWRGVPSLDYLSLSNTCLHPEPSSSPPVGTCRNKTPVSSTSPPARTTSGGDDDGSAPKMAAVSPAEWETLLGSMDGGLDNVYNAIYGGASLVHESSVPSQSHSATPRWSADLWSLRRSNSMGEFGRGMGGSTPMSAPGPGDEHLISGDDVAPLVEMGLNLGSADFGKHHVQGGVWI